jgi:hypothetical protein
MLGKGNYGIVRPMQARFTKSSLMMEKKENKLNIMLQRKCSYKDYQKTK